MSSWLIEYLGQKKQIGENEFNTFMSVDESLLTQR